MLLYVDVLALMVLYDEIDDLNINHLISEINILLKNTAMCSDTTFKTYNKAHKNNNKDNKPYYRPIMSSPFPLSLI